MLTIANYVIIYNLMSSVYIPEIRKVQSSADPLFLQARLVNNATHHYELSWSDIGQHYVAMAPDKPAHVAGLIQIVDTKEGLDDGYGEKHVTRLAVDPVYRQKGIGSALVAHMVQIEREAGLTIISTQPTNKSAFSVFAKQGFLYSPLEGRISHFRYLILNTQPTL